MNWSCGRQSSQRTRARPRLRPRLGYGGRTGLRHGLRLSKPRLLPRLASGHVAFRSAFSRQLPLANVYMLQAVPSSLHKSAVGCRSSELAIPCNWLVTLTARVLTSPMSAFTAVSASVFDSSPNQPEQPTDLMAAMTIRKAESTPPDRSLVAFTTSTQLPLVEVHNKRTDTEAPCHTHLCTGRPSSKTPSANLPAIPRAQPTITTEPYPAGSENKLAVCTAVTAVTTPKSCTSMPIEVAAVATQRRPPSKLAAAAAAILTARPTATGSQASANRSATSELAEAAPGAGGAPDLCSSSRSATAVGGNSAGDFCGAPLKRIARPTRWRTPAAPAGRRASAERPLAAFTTRLMCAVILVVASRCPCVLARDQDLVGQQIKSWAVRFAKDLKVANEVASNYSSIKASFDKDYKVVNKGNTLFEEITRSLANLVRRKQESAEHLYRETEKLVEISRYDSALVEIVNAKRLDRRLEDHFPHPDGCTDDFGNLQHDEEGNVGPGCAEKRLDLNYSSYFEQEVSFEKSAIHVATNIYTRADHVMHAIQMSAGLDNRFRANRGSDPYLSFQFFCSHTGFLRLYPAVQWPEMEPDMYECRSRSWYVQAAASAKDVVILLDVSGSMTGLRKEIARNVVVNILETLTDNDFVQVLTFKNDCLPLVPCFYMPVQANQRNIREFKEYLNKLETLNIANFSLALTEAFELLQKFNRSKGGSQCNQAIMLITDGAPSNYQDIFFRYNYPNIPVRVFTYLIGREVTDTREVNWMACSNRGYYTHVTTLAEVREQVLKYIPVMSRPIVLARKHPVIWTAAYPTVTETLLTDNLWEERERARFKAEGLRNLRRRMQRDGHIGNHFSLQNNSDYDYDGEEYDENDEYEEVSEEETPVAAGRRKRRRRRRSPEEGIVGGGHRGPELSYTSVSDQLALRVENRDYPEARKRRPLMLTTVAIPVFNASKSDSNDTNVTSHLLGVVGVDVPVRELERLASPFQLGVNAYPLILNKNGHLISHPDLRPMFQDFVKPFHSNVDLLEVELLDNQLSARDFSQTFRDLRKNMIDGRRGWTEPHNVRVHMDGMKRVAVRKQRYYYGPVGNSVFALAIALPQPYGSHGVDAQFELSNPANQKIDVYKTYLEGTDWHVHPNWTYCEDDNAERALHHLEKRGIDRVQRNAIASLLKMWRTEKNPKFTPEANRPNKMHSFKTWTCDLELLQSLVFDATRTAPHVLEQVKSQSPPSAAKSRARDVLTQSNGIISAFVATRSGLLRMQTFHEPNVPESEKFYNKFPRSIDELFYKRAVDFYYHSNASKEAFVYTVPFDAGESLRADGIPIVMTATRAVMLGASDNQSAPVAVVGVQINHAIFTEKFFNSTNNCDGKDCRFKCNSDANSFDCFLLDNNGFIVAVANTTDLSLVGKFFGEVDAAVFNQLIKYNIYKKVTVFDYQAVCFSVKAGQGSAPGLLLNPFVVTLRVGILILNAVISFIGRIISAATLNEGLFRSPFSFLGSLRAIAYASDESTGSDGTDDPHPGMAFTIVRPCDREVDLYIMANLGDNPTFGNVHQCNVACNHTFVVQPIYDSNMLLLAVPHSACRHCDRERIRLEPREAHATALLADANLTTACVKTPLHRQRPDTCYNYHAAEKEMLKELDLKEQCGSSTTSSLSWPLLLLCGLFMLLLRYDEPVSDTLLFEPKHTKLSGQTQTSIKLLLSERSEQHHLNKR